MFVSFLLVNNVYCQVFSFKNFDHSSGLQNETILSLAEDNNGFIWFGTDGAGLIQYDGENFEYFQHYDSRNQHHITGIAVSEKNEIYFSSKYKQFLKHNNKETTSLYKPSIERGSKEGIYILGNTKILFTSNSIALLDSKGLVKQHQIISDKKSLSIYQYLDLDNAVICFTSEGNFWINENVILRLSDWLGVSESTVQNFKHGTISNGTLLLLDKKLTKIASIKLHSSNPGFLEITPTNTNIQLQENETITYGNSRNNKSYFITNFGKIYSFKNNSVERVQLSKNLRITNPTQLLIDFNENIWISTVNKGVYKLSQNAFTALRHNNFYTNTNLSFLHKPDDSTIIISTDDNETFIGSTNKDDTLAYYKTRIYTSVSIKKDNYYSSKNGVFKISADKKLQPILPYFQDKSCAIFYGSEEYIWVNAKNDGLFKVYLNGRKERQTKELPSYFYTTQIIDDKQYFGTNNGLYVYDIKKNTWSKELKGYDKQHSGSYIGVSTKDKYGNIYFSADLG
ncbi:MAG: two-component regulator propeller domain-containing protein, partial [Lishizhenia sp.]